MAFLTDIEELKTGLIIFVYSLLFTSLVSFFAVMIIPDKTRPEYFGNLIGGNTDSNFSFLSVRGVYPAATMTVTIKASPDK